MELAETFLGRLESLGPEYNAVVTLTRKRAMEEARRAEREIEDGQYRGLLHGIPYGVKDLLATSGGVPTTWGAAPLRDQIFDYDATVIKRLDKGGAVLTAKLAMIELAGGMGYRQPNASFTGPTRNPWNQNAWTGGSSSGSGAAVSAGLIPFAIGSETLGSILIPANHCGIAGLRPTYGRVSRHGAMALSWTLDKLGPMCLTADDCGIVLEAIAGADPCDPTTTDHAFKYDDTPKATFELAVFSGATEGVNEEVIKNFEDALKALKRVASIEEVELPSFPFEAISRTILNVESASAFEDLIESGMIPGLTAPEDRYNPYPRTMVLAKDYLRALRLRGVMSKAIDKVMAPFDAVVAPTRATPATPIDKEFRSFPLSTLKDPMVAIGNGAGLPAISVPDGFTEGGLPTGIQFMGRAYEENKIVAVARAYQSMTEWHKRHPPVHM